MQPDEIGYKENIKQSATRQEVPGRQKKVDITLCDNNLDYGLWLL
jgi:hypothetical protein